jgi:hypothetical protein
MELNEIKAYITTNSDNEEVKAYLDSFKVQPTLEVFKSKINDADFKSFLDSEKDKHSSKSLETWKSNNLQKLIDEAVTKANPTETPEQKQIRELTERLNKKEAEELRGQLVNRALKVATEKKLPADLVDYFIGQDEETTLKNLEKLESIFTNHVNAVAEERLKSGYKPPKGDNNTGITKEMFEKMGYMERVKLSTENPQLYKELSK